MISKAPDVDTYIAEVPADRKAAIEKLRELCHQHFPGTTEGIDYGMPVYKTGDKMEVAFASQKQYIALYGMGQTLIEEFKPQLKGATFGKGCIRFKNPAALDFIVIDALMRKRAARQQQAPNA